MRFAGIVGGLPGAAEKVDAGIKNAVASASIVANVNGTARSSWVTRVRRRRGLIAVKERIELGALGTSVCHF